MDALRMIKEMADRSIMVEGIDYVRYVLTHIYLCIPFSQEKLGGSVNQVSCEYLRKDSAFISSIKLFVTIAEETEGCKYEYSVSSLALELLCYVDYGLTG